MNLLLTTPLPNSLSPAPPYQTFSTLTNYLKYDPFLYVVLRLTKS